MSVDWSENVKKYVPNADELAIAGIVRHCGIALRSRDASLVAFTDPTETDLVRESFLKRKLALTLPDNELDAAIASVGQRMHAEHFRNRVTVYYLLAEHFDKLPLFHKKGAVVAAAGVEEEAAPVAAETATADTAKAGIGGAAAVVGGAALGAAALAGSGASAVVSGAADAAGAAVSGVGQAASATGAAVTGAAGAVLAGATGVAGAAAGAAGAGAAKLVSVADHVHAPARGKGAWLIWALLLLAVLALLLWMFGCQHKPGEAVVDASATATATPSAAAAPDAVIPAGAGVTSGMRDGKPLVTVYFASGKADVVPAFADSAGGLKAYLAAHAGSTLAVSGFADKTGNAALNAQLSKKRAEAVKAALVADGVADSAIALEKPADAVDAATNNTAARRVEVVAK